MIVDTGGLLAFFNRREPMHDEVVSVVEAATDLIVSPFVLAEVDYLVATRLGVDAELAVLDELSGGAWILADLGENDLREARGVVAKYRDQNVGLADASLVVLAERCHTRRILTLDHRHFSILRPIGGGTFSLLPSSP